MKTTDETRQELLSTLTRVRLATVCQIAREFYSHCKDPRRIASRRIRDLERLGLLVTSTTMMHPLLPLTGPIYEWHPGDSEPDLDRMAWKISSRWKELPLRTQIVQATSELRRTFGAPPARAPRPTELCHDVHVSEIFFHLRRNHPELAATWQHEDELRAAGRTEAIPDAAIHRNEPILIEFAGSYAAQKLRRIHAAYLSHRYQIW